MTQTKISELWAFLDRLLPPAFEPEAITAPRVSALGEDDRFEEDRLPEREEAFYWGWHIHGHW